MRMIQSPAPDNRVEFCNQLLLRVGFAVLDDGSHFLQESMHILRRRLDEKLSVSISADVESEEIKSTGYMRDNRFLLREFQPAFRHESLYKGFDL